MKRRLFVAIEFPEETKHQIGKLIGKLRKDYSDVAWEKAEKLHLTLKFLGATEVDPGKIATTIRVKLKNFPPFTLTFGELGMFMQARMTVFLEIIKTEELLRLYHMINNCLTELGFTRDKSVFHPHVTLGKVKQAFANKLVQIKHDPVHIEVIKVKHTIVMESRLNQHGSTYTVCGRIEFVSSSTL